MKNIWSYKTFKKTPKYAGQKIFSDSNKWKEESCCFEFRAQLFSSFNSTWPPYSQRKRAFQKWINNIVSLNILSHKKRKRSLRHWSALVQCCSWGGVPTTQAARTQDSTDYRGARQQDLGRGGRRISAPPRVVEPEPPFLAGAGAVKKGRLRLQLYSSSSSSELMFK